MLVQNRSSTEQPYRLFPEYRLLRDIEEKLYIQTNNDLQYPEVDVRNRRPRLNAMGEGNF